MGRNVELPDDLHARLVKLSRDTGMKIKALVAKFVKDGLAKRSAA